MEDLPPGFRFYPTEEELVSFYLQNKLEGRNENLNRVMGRVIPALDIYEHNPWQLPKYSGDLCHGDPEQWFFFIPRQESEARGGRPNRLTTTGYWKATGSPSYVYSSRINRAIGLKRTMVFYTGRAPQGRKTEWKINEYKAIEGDHQAVASSSSNTSAPTQMQLRQEFSLCRVYKKSKCLRAFDRRPEGVEEISNRPPTIQARPAAAQDHHHHLQAGCSTSTSHNPTAHPMVMVERTMISSPGSSSSGDDHGPDDPSQPPTGEGGSSTPMALDNELAFWDWDEKLNWF